MKTLYILPALLFITLYTYADEGYILKGRIEGDYAGYVYLTYLNHKDSALVHNNLFEFSGKVDKPVLVCLYLKPLANASYIYLENSLITIAGNFSTEIQQDHKINIYTITEITGSYAHKLLEQYRKFCKENRANKSFDSLRYKELQVMFTRNPAQPVNGWILSDLAAMEPVYSYNELYALYTLLDTASMQQADLILIKTGLQAINKYGTGQAFTSFELPNQTGEMVHSTKFAGKIVLLDFWASWCGPCRAKHPQLTELQKKYRNKNFVLVSISIDQNADAWRKAIKQDGLAWENLLDGDGEIKNELSIVAIPFNYLLDEHGNIIAINQSLEKINLILEEKFK
jgi:thiol-disulfide isomerase/thioredoxin